MSIKAYRVALNGWTASFRHPQFVTGMQPTLPLPPPSTIYGLVSAAAGYWVDPDNCSFAYVFVSQGKAKDLETIYQFKTSNNAKSNVILREWLVNWQLWLYFKEKAWAEKFKNPVYPLVMGRQQELAHVNTSEGGQVVKKVRLEHTSTTLFGTIVPFPFWEAAGMVVALPLVMSPGLPRQALGVRPWQFIKEPFETNADNVLHDAQLNHGVYFIGG